MSSLRNLFAANKYQKLAIVIQVVGPVLLIGNLLIQGKVLFWGTTYLQFTPWRWLAWNQLLQGELPIWNPFNGMGAPLLANYQSALLYPPNLLLWIGAFAGGIPGIFVTQTLLVILHLIGSGIGFVYLTRFLGFKPFTQAISGISYALCAYQVSRVSFLSINAVLLWIPWLLFSILGWIQASAQEKNSTGRKYLLFCLVCISCQLLAGHAQITWYTQILSGIWMIFWTIRLRGWKGLPKYLGIYFSACMLAVGISMVQLLPTLELLRFSQRASEVGLDYAQNYSFWPWRFLNLLSPNLFGNPGLGNYWVTTDNYWENAIYSGVTVTLGTLFSLLFIRTIIKDTKLKYQVIWFSLGCILVTIPLMLGKHTPIFEWLYINIPSFNLFQAPTRFSIWMVIAMILLAAVGIDRWQPPVAKRLYWSRLAFAGAIGSIVVSIVAYQILQKSINLTYLSGVFESAILLSILTGLNLFQPANINNRKIWKGLVVLFVLADLLYANWMLNPGIYLSEVRLTNYALPVDGTRYFVSTQDEAKLKFEKFFRFDTFQPSVGWENLNKDFLPNNNLYAMHAAINNFDPLVPSRYLDAISMIEALNPSSRDQVLAWLNVSRIEEVVDQNGTMELKEHSPLGRYSWTGCSQIVEDENKAMEATQRWMGNENLNDFVVIEAKYAATNECNSDGADIRITMDKANRQEVVIETTSSGWLVQKDIWYPGWKAIVDGEEKPIIPVNAFLRGVHLEGGSHRVAFEYRPVSLLVGAGISLASLILLITLVFLNRRMQDE